MFRKGWPVMVRQRLVWRGAIAALCLAGIAVAVSAQGERKPATLDDLVAEMRGLRADLSQSSAGAMRMQVLTARLSLQEQRIAVLATQRAELVARLAGAARERGDVETRVKRLQVSLDNVGADAHMREELTAAIKAETPRVSQRQQAEQELRNQEAELAAAIASEQARWQDFNARLDDLERSLAPSRPR